uniref:Ankyrin repeat protein n=1 Tax=viral metagenome TaxID=1070528 RepID=A0A6C0JTN4_9ZZZZ
MSDDDSISSSEAETDDESSEEIMTNDDFWGACYNGDLEYVKRHINLIDSDTRKGGLCFACEKCHIKIIEFLLLYVNTPTPFWVFNDISYTLWRDRSYSEKSLKVLKILFDTVRFDGKIDLNPNYDIYTEITFADLPIYFNVPYNNYQKKYFLFRWNELVVNHFFGVDSNFYNENRQN